MATRKGRYSGKMMVLPFRTFALALAVAPVVSSWSPAFHENQTRLASAFVPRGMAAFLARHPQELLKGGRGVSSDQVPTIEEIEEQVQYIVRLGEEKRRSALVIRELGTLAHMVQLFMDPSASHGMTLLREHFQEYGDEHLSKLVVSQEPFWAVTAPLDPRPALLRWSATKWDRHRSLLEHFNSETGKPIGAWDTLSVPFAQLQLAYSNGVNATANLWIQLWRATGDTWEGLP